MLLRMQIPACSHGGSHFALGSKTNPTATPRGASEPAEQMPTRANKAANSTVEPTEVMFGLVWSQLGRVGNRQKPGVDGGENPSQVTETPPSRPRCCVHGQYNQGCAGGVSWCMGLAELEFQFLW